MPYAQLIPSFNAGELSPYMDGRNDVAKYFSGCRTLENFIVLPYGGAYRRPGTEYLGEAKYGDKRCRVAGFNFSTNTSFVLEMGDRYIRFWSNGLQVVKTTATAWATATAYTAGQYVLQNSLIYFALVNHTSGTFAIDLANGLWVQQAILEVLSPYTEAELREVQYIQINDIMYFVHPLHPVYQMKRLADTNWTFLELAFDYPAFLDENTEATTITPSATTGNITLTASASLFDPAMVGGFFQLGQTRTTATSSKAITATGTSTPIAVIGQYDFNTYGTWTASISIERSYDNGTSWETVRSYQSANDFNAADNFTQEREALIRINVTAFTSGTGRALITVAESKQYGVVKITNVASGTSASATVTKELLNTVATKFWSEGAWSTLRGFPRTVTLHEQRIFYGGTAYRPLTIWGSAVDDFDNLRIGTTEASGLSITLSAPESNPIQWMVSQDTLLIGTAGNEWTLGASDASTTIGPNNITAKQQSSYGSKYLRALVFNNVILFVQRQGRKVREFVYSFEKDGYDAPDLTVLSEHITEGEILESAFQQQPDSIYWTITGNGQLVGLTYEREQSVVGWHRHTTDGVFESVATIYGGSGSDEVWMSVQRTINGVPKRYIERFKTDSRDAFDDADKSRWWYVDCAKRVTNDPAAMLVTGFSHLNGKTVQIWADEATAPDEVVSGGQFTMQDNRSNVVAGLPYVSNIQPMFFEITAQQGSTVGGKKRIPKAFIYLLKSLGGEFQGYTDGTWNKLYAREMSDNMNQSPPVLNGPYEADVAGNSQRTLALKVRQTQPCPLTILAINTFFDVAGP